MLSDACPCIRGAEGTRTNLTFKKGGSPDVNRGPPAGHQHRSPAREGEDLSTSANAPALALSSSNRNCQTTRATEKNLSATFGRKRKPSAMQTLKENSNEIGFVKKNLPSLWGSSKILVRLYVIFTTS